MIAEQKIVQLSLITTVGSIAAIVILFCSIHAVKSVRTAERQSQMLEDRLMGEKRQYMKEAVDRTIADIEQGQLNCLEANGGKACDEDFLVDLAKSRIRNTRLKDNGYLWVNEVISFEGGPGYARRLVHPNMPETEGALLSTEMKDIKGGLPYLTELEGVKRDGSVFFTYWFKKMGSSQVEKKMSYARLYPGRNWIVATGVYLDGVVAEVAREREVSRTKLISGISLTFGLGAGLIGLTFLGWFFLRVWILGAFGAYTSAVYQKEEELLKLNNSLEEEVVRRTDEFLRSEERFREVYDSAQDMYFSISSDDGTILMCNRTANEVLGFAKGELIGKKVFSLYHPDSHAMAAKALKEIKETGSITNYELKVVKKNGQVMNVSLHSRTVTDDSGKPVYNSSSLRDISDVRKAREESREFELQMLQTQKMEAIGTLAGGIAHDFNNILSSIIGYTELTLEEMDEENEHLRNLMEVRKAGYRAKDLVKQILTFSRKGDETRKPLDLVSMVEESLGLLQAATPATVVIHSQLDVKHAMILGNSSQMHQVVMNLCTNAVQAMGSTGGTLSVRIEEAESTGSITGSGVGAASPWVQLSIRDTGEGIPEEIRERIFEPYFTTKEEGEGTGLGLSMVHGIITDHQGKILVDSGHGQGTTFRILLPLTTEENPDLLEGMKVVTGGALPGGNEMVMVVDDEAPLLEVYRRILGGLGYDIAGYTDAGDALKAFEMDPEAFDLLITDVEMPGMRGIELCRSVRSIRPKMPVMVCSGSEMRYISGIKEEVGPYADAVLIKPVRRGELVRTVRDVLDEKVVGIM